MHCHNIHVFHVYSVLGVHSTVAQHYVCVPVHTAHRFIMWIIFMDLWHFMKVLLNFIYENDFHSPHFFDLLKAVYLHPYVHVERTKVHVKRCYTRTVYHRAPHLRPFAIIESRSVVVMIRSTVDDIIDL